MQLFLVFQLQGQSRKKSSESEQLVETSQKVLAKLLSLAPSRRRNYILDQVCFLLEVIYLQLSSDG